MQGYSESNSNILNKSNDYKIKHSGICSQQCLDIPEVSSPGIIGLNRTTHNLPLTDGTD